MSRTPDEELATTMTPVFCTAKLPTSTIDALLNRTMARARESRLPCASLYVVTSRTLPDSPSQSKPPFQPFETPFLNASLSDLRSTFKEMFFGEGCDALPFTHLTFIVLDERSERDGTCMLVSNSVDAGEARAEFAISVDVLTAPEIGTAELNEAVVADGWMHKHVQKDDGEGGSGGVLYTLEGWKKFVGY